MYRHTAFKAHQLHGNLALVVVHGDHAVVFQLAGRVFADGTYKSGVGGEGAFGRKTTLPGQLHAGGDDPALFVTVVAVVSVVRVEATHGNARLGKTACLQGLVDHGDGVGHLVGS